MLASTTVLVGIFIYFFAIVFVGFLLRKKNKGAEDFLVGGRSFGVFFNTGTLVACWLGGSIVIGIPGTLYACGIWSSEAQWGILPSIGGAGCLIIAGAFYMRKLWQLKLLSLGDFYYRRFGRNAGIISTILMALTFTLWIAVQIVAFAKVGESLIGLSLNTWIIISMTVICAYTILGGLWAVCFTDIIQVIIVTLSLFILTPVAIYLIGGWDVFVETAPVDKLNFMPSGDFTPQNLLPWLAAWIMIGLGSIASPDLMQRAFSAKTPRTARRSAYCAAAIYLFIIGIVIVLTFATIQMVNMGVVDQTIIENDPELMVPMVFVQIMPKPLVIVFIGAVLAASMSAAATANIALAGVIAKNLIKDIFMPDMSSQGLMQTSRVVILGVGAISAYTCIALPSAYLLMTLGFDLILSCLFIPLTLGLYWNKANGYGAIAGLLSGAFFRIIVSGIVNGFTLEGIGSAPDTWFYFTIFGPIVSLVFMVTVSLLTQKIDKPILLELEADPDDVKAAAVQKAVNE